MQVLPNPVEASIYTLSRPLDSKTLLAEMVEKSARTYGDLTIDLGYARVHVNKNGTTITNRQGVGIGEWHGISTANQIAAFILKKFW